MIAAAIRARLRLLAERFDPDALAVAMCVGLFFPLVTLWAECAIFAARIAGVAP